MQESDRNQIPSDDKRDTLRKTSEPGLDEVRASWSHPHFLAVINDFGCSQMVAGITHRVSKERLRKIAETIPKVLILTGDEDHLVDPSNSVYLKSCMPEAEFIQWEHTGHGLHMQWRDRFNTLVERVVKEGRERLAQK